MLWGPGVQRLECRTQSLGLRGPRGPEARGLSPAGVSKFRQFHSLQVASVHSDSGGYIIICE